MDLRLPEQKVVGCVGVNDVARHLFLISSLQFDIRDESCPKNNYSQHWSHIWS